jgi:hypothetical protein
MEIPAEIEKVLNEGQSRLLFLQSLGALSHLILGAGFLIIASISGELQDSAVVLLRSLGFIFILLLIGTLVETGIKWSHYKAIDRCLKDSSQEIASIQLEMTPTLFTTVYKVRIRLATGPQGVYPVNRRQARSVMEYFRRQLPEAVLDPLPG